MGHADLNSIEFGGNMDLKTKIGKIEQKKVRDLLMFLPKILRSGETIYSSEVVVSLSDWRELMSKVNGEIGE